MNCAGTFSTNQTNQTNVTMTDCGSEASCMVINNIK